MKDVIHAKSRNSILYTKHEQRYLYKVIGNFWKNVLYKIKIRIKF